MLTMTSATGGMVVVTDKDGNVLYSGTVAPDEEFSFSGVGKDNKMGTEITVNGTQIHTSCSKPIGIGSVFGDFTVTEGTNKDGGPMSPPGPKCPKDPKGKKGNK